ncbi:MAG TPA: ATP-dependent RNA helicase HrpA [Fluviicoccus sp.]|nr:ATP-dependent RNA helicase HrpA [Fluviicoccus sp.]
MQKAAFFAALDTCLVADRPRLIGRWQRLRGVDPGKREEAVAQLQGLIEQSQARVAKRHAGLPEICLNDDLPVSARANDIIAAIREHQVVVVAGETGSGKTTQLPKLCLLAGRGRTGYIGHTQPRRLAARSVAARIAEELGSPLGEVVGFKVRFSEAINPDGYVKLMTDGILLAELTGDRYLNAYDTLIIDEAHERSLNIDFLLGYLRQLLDKRPDLKVVITSATLDVERFSRHFNNAPVINVEGRTFPVELLYRPISEEPVKSDEDDSFEQLEDALPRAVLAAVEECVEHGRRSGRPGHGDILIFASTEREIRELAETLRKYGPQHTEVLPLYARLSLNEQQKIFHPTGKGRRIVIATNVAETSLTVPNIYYVIDPGFARISRYSYRSRVQRLPIEAVSQAAANQRKGRCGRIAPGVCIRLYSEEDFLGRPEFTEPEIRRTHLASVILQMHSLGLGDISQFPFVEPPDSRFSNDGVRVLEELGALDDDHKLTNLGRQLSRFPLDPRLARMIIAGAHNGCLDEMLMIVSAISVQDPRERPPEKQTQADQKHALFREPDSDFLFYVKLWRTFEEVRGDLSENQRRQWAKTHFISYLRLREWKETHHQLLIVCKEFNLVRNSEPANYETIHRALLSGLLAQIAHKGDDREFIAARNQKAKIFPGSILHKKSPPWVMASEVVETSQVYLRTVAKVEPEWIEQEGKHLLKHHVFEPHWEKGQGRVMAYEQLSLFGLIVNPKRKLSYEKVNPVEAREIFIRSALVEGDINLKAAFLKHNRQLVDDITRVEDKVRRRDLLVDDEVLYAFYDRLVPPTIANARAFDGWRHDEERKHPEILFLKPEDLLTGDSLPAIDEYPDHLDISGLRLPLSYRFDPSAEDDGVTVSVPYTVLPQISAAALSWLVPGLLADKVEALLKALPKALRRQLVPVPDTVKFVLEKLEGKEHSAALESVLSQILMQKGLRVTTEDWRDALQQLPVYCRFNLRVVDEKGKTLATGRDLEELRIKFAGQKVTVQPVTDELLTTFPDAIPPVMEKKVAGLPSRSYAALVAGEKGVSLQYLSSEAEAQREHYHGMVWLCKHQCAAELKQVKKYITPALTLDYAAFGNKQQLEEQTVNAVFRTVCQTENVYTRDAYDAWLGKVRPKLLSEAARLVQQLGDIYKHWREVQKELQGVKQPVFAPAVEDIKAQLDALNPASFAAEVSNVRWKEYARYLKAVQLRLQRLPNNLLRDTQGTQDIQRRWKALLQKRTDRIARGLPLEPVEEYRWLLEEYRISLFSQPMKTAVPVSAQRLDKLWSEL